MLRVLERKSVLTGKVLSHHSCPSCPKKTLSFNSAVDQDEFSKQNCARRIYSGKKSFTGVIPLSQPVGCEVGENLHPLVRETVTTGDFQTEIEKPGRVTSMSRCTPGHLLTPPSMAVRSVGRSHSSTPPGISPHM